MTSPFLGEIKMFVGTYAPSGYALCLGQQMAVAQNEKLFSVLGYTYGGSGSVFALPHFGGRVPIGLGQAPGIAEPFTPGQEGGVESIRLNPYQLPTHRHLLDATTSPATQPSALASTASGESSTIQVTSSFLAAAVDAANTPVPIYANNAFPSPASSLRGLTQEGESAEFSLRNPYLAISYLIAVDAPWVSEDGKNDDVEDSDD